MRTAFLAIAIGLLSVVAVPAQDAEQDVRRAIEDGNAAARRTDKAGYARFLADDLTWVGEDGKEFTKQQRLDGMQNGPTTAPTVSDMRVRVYGDAAAVIGTLTSAGSGRKSRMVRTMIKQDGRWQLVLHAQMPIQ